MKKTVKKKRDEEKKILRFYFARSAEKIFRFLMIFLVFSLFSTRSFFFFLLTITDYYLPLLTTTEYYRAKGGRGKGGGKREGRGEFVQNMNSHY